MSYNDLCWKCKEALKHVEGYDLQLIIKHLHCHRHHEPKKKSECWCDRKHSSCGIVDGISTALNFCPQCGKDLRCQR